MKLRDYQLEVISMIDERLRQGDRRVLYVASPGAGKTEVASAMIQRCLKYDYPVVFIVRGRELVGNASNRFKQRGIDHSIFMAGDWRLDRKKLVQVCSIDTMKSRGEYPHMNRDCLIFIDEAHKDYSSVFEMYPNSPIIGMTGTPFSDMSKYQSIAESITPQELRDLGYLVPDKVYCPHIIDTSSVTMRAGDFNKKELNNVVINSAIIGDVVNDWIELGENRPTVCFAVSVEHSMQLAQAFREKGISAIHCDASSSEEERARAKTGLEDGSIKVVCNVDIFSTGWDCPIVSCIILARPTWSLNWYLQAVGRGVRSYPGKTNCIVLDNAGNVFRHGSHFKVREVSLDAPEKRKKSRAYENRVVKCEGCFLMFDPTEHRSCPDCGWEIPEKSRRVNSIDGKLIEYEEHEEDKIARRKAMIIEEYRNLERTRRAKKFREVWVFSQLLKKYSREEIAHLKLVTSVPSQFLPLP